MERRFEYRAGVIVELLRPLIMLAFGILVGLIVVGLFMPVVKLVNDLS